jgi:hypothetical protein
VLGFGLPFAWSKVFNAYWRGMGLYLVDFYDHYPMKRWIKIREGVFHRETFVIDFLGQNS